MWLSSTHLRDVQALVGCEASHHNLFEGRAGHGAAGAAVLWRHFWRVASKIPWNRNWLNPCRRHLVDISFCTIISLNKKHKIYIFEQVPKIKNLKEKAV